MLKVQAILRDGSVCLEFRLMTWMKPSKCESSVSPLIVWLRLEFWMSAVGLRCKAEFVNRVLLAVVC